MKLAVLRSRMRCKLLWTCAARFEGGGANSLRHDHAHYLPYAPLHSISHIQPVHESLTESQALHLFWGTPERFRLDAALLVEGSNRASQKHRYG